MDEFPQTAPPSQNWKLTLAYDGTNFRGWQVQPGECTVQGELQAALRRITCEEAPLPQGSGRTDAGVHARAQVASVALRAPIPAENLLRALNRTLPASIRILEARPVRSTFHARHSAVAKTYEYHVFLEKPDRWCEKHSPGKICSPFLAPYVFAYSWPLDVDALQKSASAFVGEHDFLSFAATDPDLTTRKLDLDEKQSSGSIFRSESTIEPPTAATVRRIFSSQWDPHPTEEGDLLIYRVRGNGFLHHMVRNLVGTMLEVGRGQLHPNSIPGIIAARRRSAAGPTAPARGLFLHSVEYDGAE